MSKNKYRRASTEGASNAVTTEPTPQPTQEKQMEAQTQDTQTPPATPPQSEPEAQTQTAKQMALAEEENAARLVKQAQMQNGEVVESVPVSAVAAQGYDALQEQFRRHAEHAAKKKEYTPPPRTEKQMTALQEELEAGARAVARAQAQQQARVMEAPDHNKEGFTTPVYRPNDVVPDPLLTGSGRAGVKGFDPEA
jgi:hypothetical protein